MTQCNARANANTTASGSPPRGRAAAPRLHRAVAIVGLACLFSPGGARAERPRFFEVEGFGRFLDGNPETTAITEEGAVILPPVVRQWYGDAAASYSAAVALGDEVVLARVDDGQVLAVDRAGKTRNLYKVEESLASALLPVRGGLLVAAGPPARIYRVDARGRAELLYSLDASYVWGMVEGPGGSLYCVTGEPGTLVQLSGKSESKVIFQPEQAHLRSIAFDKKLGLFVGGGERGVVYHARDKNFSKFHALFDSGHEEVTAMVIQAPHVFVAGVSGAEAVGRDNAAGEGGGKGGSRKGGGGGGEVRSQLVRVAMDGAAEVLAGSNDEAVFDLALDGRGNVVVATGATGRDDPRGRLYTVASQKRLISMIYQSPSRRITHLVELPRSALAAVAGGGGRVVHLTDGYATSGELITAPFDAGINSLYGMLQVFGTSPKGTRVLAAVRTGQTATPDLSWSSWSEPVVAPGGKAAQVPKGRYSQIKLVLEGNGKQTPSVYRARLAYLRQNLPPFVREVVALKKGIALLPMVREERKSKTISLFDKAGDDVRADKTAKSNGGGSGMKQRARQVEERGALTVKWVADDPNGDNLKYDLMFRPAGLGADWRTLQERLEDPFYTLRSTQLPDGHYQFKVRATDAPSNPDGLAMEDSRESLAVLVDNTPPRVDAPVVEVRGRTATIRAQVADAVGPLIDATYALDSRDERPLLPDDGILDGPAETFTLELSNLAAGDHALTIRVVDEAENEGFGEATFSVP